MLDAIGEALREACPGLRIDGIERLEAGYTSRQWVADTDEGRLLAKTPVRNKDPEHLRTLIAATRRAAEGGLPVVRFRAFVPHSAPLDGPLIVQEFQAGAPADAAWDGMSDQERLAFAADLGQLVGRVHSCRGDWWGDLLGRHRHPDGSTALHALVDGHLAKAPAGSLDDRLAGALHRAVDRLRHDAPPVLTHGDLWRPNLILRDGRIACLLDFEHARYTDRFLDFGKLDEHIFDRYPAGREPFLAAYTAVCPVPDDWEHRVALAHVLHALGMAVYFRRWSPELAGEYEDILSAWLSAGGAGGQP